VVEEKLGKKFWLKTVGIVIGLGIVGLICILLFTGLVARFGVIAGLVIVFGVLMLIMYRADKKEQARYEES
jgi:undecaprenyl pyrophosphate phosphatase UppP